MAMERVVNLRPVICWLIAWDHGECTMLRELGNMMLRGLPLSPLARVAFSAIAAIGKQSRPRATLTAQNC